MSEFSDLFKEFDAQKEQQVKAAAEAQERAEREKRAAIDKIAIEILPTLDAVSKEIQAAGHSSEVKGVRGQYEATLTFRMAGKNGPFSELKLVYEVHGTFGIKPLIFGTGGRNLTNMSGYSRSFQTEEITTAWTRKLALDFVKSVLDMSH